MTRCPIAITCTLILLGLTAGDTIPPGQGGKKPDKERPGSEKPSERLQQEFAKPRQVPIEGPGTIEFDPAFGVRRMGQKLLPTQPPEVRLQTAMELGKYGQALHEAATWLRTQGLKDPDERVRAAAAEALGELGPSASLAVPDLNVALKDPNERVQTASINALGQIGALGEEAVPTLTAMLEHKSVVVRSRSATTLGLIGPGAASAVPALVKALGLDQAWSQPFSV